MCLKVGWGLGGVGVDAVSSFMCVCVYRYMSMSHE